MIHDSTTCPCTMCRWVQGEQAARQVDVMPVPTTEIVPRRATTTADKDIHVRAPQNVSDSPVASNSPMSDGGDGADSAICDDIDLLITSLAAQGEWEEAERLRHLTLACFGCHGVGFLTPDTKCDDCSGTGVEQPPRLLAQATSKPLTRRCRDCDGTGIFPAATTCHYCHGIGSVATHDARQATSRTFSAFEISNALLDVLDGGHVVNGLRFNWEFDAGNEDFANSQRLDLRDAVLTQLRKEQA